MIGTPLDPPYRAMAASIQPEEVDQGVLRGQLGGFNTAQRTTDAANDPFSHLRLWLMSSAACSGTSVSALLGLTYDSVHLSLALATSSKHKILASGKRDSFGLLPYSHLSSAKNMFFVKIFIPYIPLRPSRAATATVSSALLALTCVVPVKILFQRSTLYRSKAIRGECPGQDAHTMRISEI